jgi:uncharacterized membrane protein
MDAGDDMDNGKNEIRQLAQALLTKGTGPLTPRERRTLERIARRLDVPDLNREIDENITFGQRLADRVAAWGGSWSFISLFAGFLLAWAALNTLVLGERAFDPYPYVFLNLVLSMVAALQAPIIMMSQNRQSQKDRLAAALDYEVNVRSEVEIVALHDKVDRLTTLVSSLQAREEGRRTDRDDTGYAEAA